MPRRSKIYDYQWVLLQRRHLKLFPMCSVVGCRKKARHVDHIVPVKEAPHRRLDPTNLESLCHAHHNIVTKAYDAGSIAGACDVDGKTLDPGHPWAQEGNDAAILAVNEKRPLPNGYAGALKRDAVKQRGQMRHLEPDQN